MSKTFLVPIDLKQNELRNAVLQNLGAAPSSPAPLEGQVYYDSTSHKPYVYNGTLWLDVSGAGSVLASTFTTKGDLVAGTGAGTYVRQGVGADGTLLVAASGQASGIQWRVLADGDIPAAIMRDSEGVLQTLAAAKGDIVVASGAGVWAKQTVGANNTILVAASGQANGVQWRALVASDIQELLATNDLTDWPRVAALDLNGQKLTGVADGTAATDGATFGQLNAILQGQKWKGPVRAVATGNLTLSGTQTVDGVALVAGDRVLAAGQTTAANSGVYIVAAGAWTRATDADTATEINQATVLVQGGTVGSGDVYTQTATIATLGTDAQTWTKTGEGNTTYTSDGTTIELVGNSFRIAATAAGNGLGGGGGSALSVNTDGTTLEVSGDNVRIAAGAAGAGLTGGGGAALAVGAGTGITVTADAVAIDPAVAVTKYATAFGDGSAVAYTITHNLGTRDVIVSVYNASSPYDEVLCDIEHTTANTVTLRFTVAPTTNQYRVVVHA